MGRTKKPLAYHMEKLWTNKIVTPAGCWEWQGSRNRQGYGQTTFPPYKIVRVHRFIYEIIYGKPDKGMVIMHLCDNPPCYNPDHLHMGTYKDNFQDALRKGRLKLSGPPVRSFCKRGHSLLTEDSTYRNGLTPKGKVGRKCKICHRDRVRQYRLRSKLKNS